MEIGLNLPVANPNTTPAFLKEIAQQAEALGFAELYLGEHVVLFDDPNDAYPGNDEGVAFFASMINMPDPLQGLTFLAGCTDTIRFATGVLLLPQRNPVYTAKQVATLDWLSGGRFDLAIGVGWSSDEYRACDVDFDDRGARCREYVEVMKTLWVDALSQYEGRFYSLPPCRQFPKPVQQPHPPLWFGGYSRAAFERVADLGTGWYAFDMSPHELAQSLRRLQHTVEGRGRDFAEVKICLGAWTTMPVTLDDLRAYARLGVDQFVLSPTAATRDEMHAQVDGFAREFVGRV